MPSLLRNVVAAALVAFSTVACAGMKGAVNLRDFTATPVAPAATVVGAGDLVAIRVWNADQMTTRQRVRPDGTVALFFMDSLPVVGLTPSAVEAEIAKRLDGIFVSPRVSVTIEESVRSTVTVLGEVQRPGTYAVARPLTVLETLALASGLTEFARKDLIVVLRGGDHPMRIRVRYEELLRGDDRIRGLVLHAGDVLVVE